jgi:putative Holliday junction resolvase
MPAAAAASRAIALPLSFMTEEVLLGFDFGAKRIGVAIGNGVTRNARALTIIDAAGDARWQAIAAVIAEWKPARLVVGIPRHPDGAAHEMTARCERFARQLEGRFRLPVARVDERYSSVEADARSASRHFPSLSRGGGRGGDGFASRGEIDDRAAAVILQQWIDENTSQPIPTPAPPLEGEGRFVSSSSRDEDEES